MLPKKLNSRISENLYQAGCLYLLADEKGVVIRILQMSPRIIYSPADQERFLPMEEKLQLFLDIPTSELVDFYAPQGNRKNPFEPSSILFDIYRADTLVVMQEKILEPTSKFFLLRPRISQSGTFTNRIDINNHTKDLPFGPSAVYYYVLVEFNLETVTL